jgi:hypothetical protein
VVNDLDQALRPPERSHRGGGARPEAEPRSNGDEATSSRPRTRNATPDCASDAAAILGSSLKNACESRIIQKLILWEELSFDVADRRCPYSGVHQRPHAAERTGRDRTHPALLSRRLDDSLNNKTVAMRASQSHQRPTARPGRRARTLRTRLGLRRHPGTRRAHAARQAATLCRGRLRKVAEGRQGLPGPCAERHAPPQPRGA